MKKGDILTDKIKYVEFYKEERIAQGNTQGIYSSCYIARLSEYSLGIVVIDKLVEQRHPEWQNKTSNRAVILSQEFRGQFVKFKVGDIFAGGYFEGELII